MKSYSSKLSLVSNRRSRLAGRILCSQRGRRTGSRVWRPSFLAARRIKVEVITLELAADRRARANSMRSDRSPGSANAIKASGQMRHTNGPIPHARGPSGFFGPPAKTRVPWTVY